MKAKLNRWYCIFCLLLAIDLNLLAQIECGFNPPYPIAYPNRAILFTRNESKIPVVFHILTQEGKKSPISDEVILRQINTLNKDFAGDNPKVSSLPNDIKDLVGSMSITFYLPLNDNFCNKINPIIRKTTTIENIGTHVSNGGKKTIHYSNLGGSDAINPAKVLNIWVADLEAIRGFGSAPGSTPVQEDGILIDPSYFGTHDTNDPDYNEGHTLTHEIGHYFGLLHIWGLLPNECLEDDGIIDTPLSKGPCFFCKSDPCENCAGKTNLYQNFMDYTIDPCLSMFTKGQIERMAAVLSIDRSSLLSQPICEEEIVPKRPFPNPFYHGIFVQKTKANCCTKFNVISLDGKIIHPIISEIDQYYYLDFGHFPQGVYLIKIFNTESKTDVLKAVKI